MIRQIRSFLGVGLLATLLHVTVALMAEAIWNVSPRLANLLGFAVAVGLSYLGHALATFGNPAGHAVQIPRFVALSLAALALSTGITVLVCSVLDGPFLVAQAAVAATVPFLTFVVSRFWVFAPLSPEGGPVSR